MPFVFHQPIWVLFRCHFQDLYISFISYYKMSITDYKGTLKHEKVIFKLWDFSHAYHQLHCDSGGRKNNTMPMNPKRTQIMINASHHKSLCSWISYIDLFSLHSAGRSSTNIPFNSIEILVYYTLCILWNSLIDSFLCPTYLRRISVTLDYKINCFILST